MLTSIFNQNIQTNDLLSFEGISWDTLYVYL
jgi:hypothetical protein